MADLGMLGDWTRGVKDVCLSIASDGIEIQSK